MKKGNCYFNVICVCIFLFITACRALAQDHTVMTSCPPCSNSQWQAWKDVYLYSQGADGKDVFPVSGSTGHTIGLNHREKYWVVSPTKQKLCGEVKKYQIFNNNGPEFDWNIKLKPDTKFASLAVDAENTMRAIVDGRYIIPGQPVVYAEDYKFESWTKYEGVVSIKGEIDVDEELRNNNEYFPTADVDVDDSEELNSYVNGKKLCMYGTFVLDVNHYHHPEIHPSELLWWRENTVRSDADTVYLWALQDDSNRFDRESDFSIFLRQNATLWSRPWSANPRWNEFKLAFWADNFGNSISKTWLTQLYKRNLTSSSITTDSDNGQSHELKIGDKTIASVEEMQNTGDIGVKFVNVCRTTAAQSLTRQVIGYISVSTSFGLNDRGGEGFHVIRAITQNPTGPLSILSADEIKELISRTNRIVRPRIESVRPLVQLQFGTLRKVNKSLVTDIALVDPKNISKRLGVKTATIRGNKKGATVLAVKDNWIQGVPLLGQHVSIDAGNGPRKVRMPRIQLGVTSDTIITTNRKASDASLTALTSKMGEVMTNGPGRFVQGSTHAIEVLPFYGPVLDSMFMPEDQNPLTEQLNATINDAKGGKLTGYEALFGKDGMKIKWAITATDVATGNPEPVRLNREGKVISSKLSQRAFAGDVVTIRFANDLTSVYRVDVCATASDAFSNSATWCESIWSHYFIESSVASLSANMMEIADRNVMSSTDENPKGYHILNNAAFWLSKDGIVTPGELEGFNKLVVGKGKD